MNNINDYSVYNEGMKKSLIDKIFFMDKVDAKIFIDFGCANGTLIHFLHSIFPEFQYIGYDIDNKMLEEAKQKFDEEELSISVMFTSNWEEVLKYSRTQKSAVILSSVIHEVYAYGSESDAEYLWKHIFDNKFDYVIIRDMIPSRTVDRPADLNETLKVVQNSDPNMLQNFENIWGSIENNKNLLHWFLKYRYKENWSREVYENYLPMFREELLRKIPSNYDLVFHEHYTLPFLKRTVKKDYGVEIKDNTHLKIILEKSF
jgi:hypothetical protein